MSLRTSEAQEELKCYGLPYGALGFASHVLMLYTLMCLLHLRRSYWPFSRISPGWFSGWNVLLSIVTLSGTTTLTIITMVRCKDHWQFMLLAVEHLCLSIVISMVGFIASTADTEENHTSLCLGIYFALAYPGTLVGSVGYLSLLVENWHTKDVRIAFGSVMGGAFGFGIVIACLIAATGGRAFLIFLHLFSVAMSDWVLGAIAGNMSGKPTGKVALLTWLYFAFRRLLMLAS